MRGACTQTREVHTCGGGAGKTTLLDTLAGRTPSSLCATGDIRVNGHGTQMSYGTVAYVPQHDLFTGSLTVRETLTFTAHLRCPALFPLLPSPGWLLID